MAPINGNIHCTGISAARQRNRRRAKKEIKVGEGLGLPELFLNSTSDCTTGYQAKLSALSNKKASKERVLPLASEGEVEHEEDSLELWRNKLVA